MKNDYSKVNLRNGGIVLFIIMIILFNSGRNKDKHQFGKIELNQQIAQLQEQNQKLNSNSKGLQVDIQNQNENSEKQVKEVDRKARDLESKLANVNL
jgi:hypothetical protein